MSAYSDLVAAFRTEADDTAAPYLWDDAYILQIAIDAQKEAAERALLIEDDGHVNPDLLELEWEAGDERVTLPPSVIQVRSVEWHPQGSTEVTFLTGISLEELNEDFPRGWRNETATAPRRFIDPQQKYLTPYPLPSIDGDLVLAVYRRPIVVLEDVGAGVMEFAFEIGADHIAGLVHWMLHRAYGKRDSDGYDANLSAKHDGLFTARFGPKYDANDLRRQRARTKNVVAFNPTW